uniref:Uncharacterized protein n=2 Tax=Oryza rufipogon TaxID=4529 RepID=A0A0E0R481_ORYRU
MSKLIVGEMIFCKRTPVLLLEVYLGAKKNPEVSQVGQLLALEGCSKAMCKSNIKTNSLVLLKFFYHQ